MFKFVLPNACLILSSLKTLFLKGEGGSKIRVENFCFLTVICLSCIICSRSLPFPSPSKHSSKSPFYRPSYFFLQASALSRVLSPNMLLTEAMPVCICFRVGWCIKEHHTCKKTTKLETSHVSKFAVGSTTSTKKSRCIFFLNVINKFLRDFRKRLKVFDKFTNLHMQCQSRHQMCLPALT